MNKHTPGPWELETIKTSIGICHTIGTFPSNGIREKTYACIYDDGASMTGKNKISVELQANARLIAAAPDLLEAAKKVCEAYEEVPIRYRFAIMDELEDAIRKAVGDE